MIYVRAHSRLTRIKHAGIAVSLSMLLIGFTLGMCVAQAAGWGSYGK